MAARDGSLANEAAQTGRDPLVFLAALMEADVLQQEGSIEYARLGPTHFPEVTKPSNGEFYLVPSLDPALVAALAIAARSSPDRPTVPPATSTNW